MCGIRQLGATGEWPGAPGSACPSGERRGRGVMGDADADAEVRIPRSALGSVQRALACVHAAVGLHATLQAIAEGVTSSTPYTNVTVTAAREPDAVDLHVEAVVGAPNAVAMLLGTRARRAE